MPTRRKKTRQVIRQTIPADGAAEYLTPSTLVRRWDGAVTLGTLKNWRYQGRGPPWLKLERQVVYPLKYLSEWEETNMRPKVPL